MQNFKRLLFVGGNSLTRKASSLPNKNHFLSATTQQNCYSSVRHAKPTVTIFGGNGFVGQELLKRIAPQCDKVIVACRGNTQFEPIAQRYGENITVVNSDVTDVNTIDSAIYGSDVVINLTGILYESDNTFVQVYIEGASNISHSAHRLGVDQMINITFLNSDLDSPSWWSDTNFRAEDIVYGNFPTATFVKPSIMFDKKENRSSGAYINKIRRTPLKFLPIIPTPFSGAKLQPVFVGDVISAIEKSIFSKVEETKGKSLYLAGPEELTLQQVLGKTFGRPAIPTPYPLYDFILGCTQMLPNPVVTRDQFNVLRQNGGDLTLKAAIDRIVEPTLKKTIMTFEDLEIEPKAFTTHF